MIFHPPSNIINTLIVLFDKPPSFFISWRILKEISDLKSFSLNYLFSKSEGFLFI